MTNAVVVLDDFPLVGDYRWDRARPEDWRCQDLGRRGILAHSMFKIGALAS